MPTTRVTLPGRYPAAVAPIEAVMGRCSQRGPAGTRGEAGREVGCWLCKTPAAARAWVHRAPSVLRASPGGVEPPGGSGSLAHRQGPSAVLELSRGRGSATHLGAVDMSCRPVCPQKPRRPTHTREGSRRVLSAQLVGVGCREGLQSVGDGDVKTLYPRRGTARARGPRAGSLWGSGSAAWPGWAGGLTGGVDRTGPQGGLSWSVTPRSWTGHRCCVGGGGERRVLWKCL